LYNEITDHLRQFATLKAMGFSNHFLRRIILGQALILSVAGFSTGVVFALLADRYIASQSMLPIGIGVGSGIIVCCFTLVMCMAAGLIAVRRVATADPAALY
jgi:putative ABC transport system permease protein